MVGRETPRIHVRGRLFVITYDDANIHLSLDALSYSHASAAELTGTSLFTVGGTLGNFLDTIDELAVYGYALDRGRAQTVLRIGR